MYDVESIRNNRGKAGVFVPKCYRVKCFADEAVEGQEGWKFRRGWELGIAKTGLFQGTKRLHAGSAGTTCLVPGAKTHPWRAGRPKGCKNLVVARGNKIHKKFSLIAI